MANIPQPLSHQIPGIALYNDQFLVILDIHCNNNHNKHDIYS